MHFFASKATQKDPFSTGFIRVYDFVQPSARFTEKPTGFGSFWSHFAKMTSKVSVNDRVYKGFWNTFAVCSKHTFYQWFCVFSRKSKMQSRLTANLMVFCYFWKPIRKNGSRTQIIIYAWW